MGNKMTFDVDRKAVTEGDIVEIKWDCTGADRVELNIDNGYKASAIELPIAGSKRFRLNRSKGSTKLTVTVWKDGKHGSKSIKVRVSPLQTSRAETVDDNGRRVSGVSEWWTRMQLRVKQLPPDKRLALRASLIICASLLLGIFVPGLLQLGLLGLMVYLLFVVWKH
ncbi:MAG: hypothetical protein IJ760_02000 [Bacteroidales bacterium]|nr:hypothetical protein [Bacteroidales bacterium]